MSSAFTHWTWHVSVWLNTFVCRRRNVFRLRKFRGICFPKESFVDIGRTCVAHISKALAFKELVCFWEHSQGFVPGRRRVLNIWRTRFAHMLLCNLIKLRTHLRMFVQHCETRKSMILVDMFVICWFLFFLIDWLYCLKKLTTRLAISYNTHAAQRRA